MSLFAAAASASRKRSSSPSRRICAQLLVTVSSVALGRTFERLRAARLPCAQRRRPHRRCRGAPPPRATPLAQRAAQQLVEALLGGVARSRPSAPVLERALDCRVASVSTRRSPRAAARRAVGSSRIVNPGGTPASSGKRCSRRSQNAWMVCTLSPPGVSMARREQRARALDLGSASACGPRARASAVCELCLVHRHPLRQRANTRLDISAAAALV